MITAKIIKTSERKSMKPKLLVLILVLVMSMSLAFCQNSQSMIGKEAPDFSLKNINGETFKLSELKGNFVVIHFATSW
jgi:cytochrome oxidase Cu insertion factor (SCO1/SenC/PrrC family)